MTERRTCSNGCDKPVHADGKCNTCYARDLRADTTKTVRTDQPCDKCGRVHTRCTSHRNRNHKTDPGGPCTQHPRAGLTVCGTHGGKAPHVKAAGERRAAENNARNLAARWGAPVDTTPTEAILTTIRVWAGLEQFYRERVRDLDNDQLAWGVTRETEGDVVVGNGPTAKLDKAAGTVREARPNVWIALHAEASDKLVKYAAEALRIGIEQHKVRLAEQQGGMVADVIQAVLADLQLTVEQQQRAPQIVARRLRDLMRVA